MGVEGPYPLLPESPLKAGIQPLPLVPFPRPLDTLVLFWGQGHKGEARLERNSPFAIAQSRSASTLQYLHHRISFTCKVRSHRFFPRVSSWGLAPGNRERDGSPGRCFLEGLVQGFSSLGYTGVYPTRGLGTPLSVSQPSLSSCARGGQSILGVCAHEPVT